MDKEKVEKRRRGFRGHTTYLLTSLEGRGRKAAWHESREWWLLACRTM